MVKQIKKLIESDPHIEAIRTNSRRFTERIFQTREDVYAIMTTIFLWMVMSPVIIKEAWRPEDRFIDWKFFVIEFKAMPAVAYYVIITIGLSISVNFARSILTGFVKYIESRAKK